MYTATRFGRRFLGWTLVTDKGIQGFPGSSPILFLLRALLLPVPSEPLALCLTDPRLSLNSLRILNFRPSCFHLPVRGAKACDTHTQLMGVVGNEPKVPTL